MQKRDYLNDFDGTFSICKKDYGLFGLVFKQLQRFMLLEGGNSDDINEFV